ncbi:MAG TPA: hypothetical protein VKE71_06005 [Candidatus Angelobacter sp.]|nr:hypothetical protein [Candidatus Angelobacter sp.]
MKPLATATFRCALCNETAGTVELLPPGHPEGFSKDTSTIFLKDFIGTEQVVVSAAVSPHLQAALDKTDAAALYQVELLWAPFYCPTCARVYCRKHWVIIPEYDEGYFDCSHGTCPEGHRRLTED